MNDKKIPYLEMPFCDNEAFCNAAATVEKCRSDTQCYSFVRPFFAPGGDYGDCWWSLDYALAVDGYKWISPQCETDFLINMVSAQQDDGRIKLYGIDRFDTHFRDRTIIVSSLPKYFETVRGVFDRTDDDNIRRSAYDMLSSNLDWWYRSRYNEQTSLYYAVFEETFVPNTDLGRHEYCPVDLNMQLVRGYRNTAFMAEYFGEKEKSAEYTEKGESLLKAIEKYLWNEEMQAYCPYDPLHNKHFGVLMVSAFDAMMFDNACREHKKALLGKMLDNNLFGWDDYALTTFAKNEPRFRAIRGAYCGNPCWSGSVWTLTNRAVIQALEEAGEKALAAELAFKTVEEFRNNYTEFLHPFTGEGNGVKDYAWTAAQFIQIIIENIFGISYNAIDRSVSIIPNLPEKYCKGKYILDGLLLPDGSILNVKIVDGDVSYGYNGSFDVVTENFVSENS